MTPEDILDIAQRRGNDEALKVAKRCKDLGLIKLIEIRMNPPKPKRVRKTTSVRNDHPLGQFAWMQPLEQYQ